MRCPFCGRDLPNGALFCDSCGNRMVGQPVKKSPLVPILISVIAVLAVAGGVLLFVFVFNKDDRADDTQTETKVETTAVPAETPKPEEEKTDQQPDKTDGKGNDTSDGEEASSRFDVSKVTPAEANTLGSAYAREYAKKFSTDETPDEKNSQFEWASALFSEDDVERFFHQTGAVQLINSDLCFGGWLAYIPLWGDDLLWEGVNKCKIFNMNLSQGEAVFNWDTYIYEKKNGEWDQVDESGKTDVESIGWSEGTFYMSTGNDKFDIEEFIELDGKQYAQGIYHFDSEHGNRLFLVRP